MGLRILRKRPDGYHDIETVFHRIDLHDELTVERADDLRVICSDPTIAQEENLVLLAARKLAERTGCRQGGTILLSKRIPHGAGLGGGSSDAAATLLLLRRFWNLAIPDRDLAELALGLGSDVPYFLQAGSAHALSRGERLTYFPLELPYAILVVSPAVRVATRDAYAAVQPRERDSNLLELLRRNLDRPASLSEVLTNDFEETIFRAQPAVGRLKSELDGRGADITLLCGSGSSVFGLFSDGTKAAEAARYFGGEHRVSLTAPGFSPPPGEA